MWRRPGQLGGHREKVMSSRVGLDQEKGMSKKRKREGGRLPHMRVSKSGRIQNKFGLRYYPTPNASGRCVVGLSSAGRVAHVFLNILVYVLFSNLDPKKVKPGHTIDHIDRVPTNNCFENLQIANKKEQRANQDRSGVTRGVPVVATNLETNEKVRYGSAREAARATGVSKTMVVECCQGKQEKSKGYSFAYAESQEPMEGEVFKPFGNKGHQVSNMGRIKLKSGTIFTPVSVDEDGYYFFAGERVHILVCTAFKGPRPSKEHTVDHLDGDKSNNTAVNLEWATKQEQSLNQGEHRPRATNQWRGRQVTTTVSTGEWIPFTTVKEAAKGTGCVAQHIHDCANPNQNRKKAKDGNGVEWEWKKVDGAPIGRTIHTTKEFTSWQVFETIQLEEYALVHPRAYLGPDSVEYRELTTAAIMALQPIMMQVLLMQWAKRDDFSNTLLRDLAQLVRIKAPTAALPSSVVQKYQNDEQTVINIENNAAEKSEGESLAYLYHLSTTQKFEVMKKWVKDGNMLPWRPTYTSHHAFVNMGRDRMRQALQAPQDMEEFEACATLFVACSDAGLWGMSIYPDITEHIPPELYMKLATAALWYRGATVLAPARDVTLKGGMQTTSEDFSSTAQKLMQSYTGGWLQCARAALHLIRNGVHVPRADGN